MQFINTLNFNSLKIFLDVFSIFYMTSRSYVSKLKYITSIITLIEKTQIPKKKKSVDIFKDFNKT